MNKRGNLLKYSGLECDGQTCASCGGSDLASNLPPRFLRKDSSRKFSCTKIRRELMSELHLGLIAGQERG